MTPANPSSAPTIDGAVPQARRLRVRGRVQGVGFRDACVRQARAMGLGGWVRNRSDGSVELLLQGTTAQLDAMARWLWHGIAGARVDELLATPELQAPPWLQPFRRWPTE